MLQALGPFRPILLTALFMTVGQGVMATVLPVRLAEVGASAQLAGLVTTAYFVGQVFGTRLGHRLLGRSGHIRAFVAMIAAAAVCTLVIPMVENAWVWMLLRFAMGVVTVLAILVMESWLNIAADNRVRGSVFGAYMVVCFIGLTAGQWLIGLMDAGAYQVFSAAAMMYMLSVIPMALTRRSQPELPPASRVRLIDLLRISPVGIAAAVASGGLIGTMFGLFPFFAVWAGMAAHEVAAFMAAVIGGGLALNWPLGRLSDKIDRRVVIAGASSVVVAMSGVIAFGGGGFAMLVLAGGLMGGAAAALYSLGVAHTNDYVGGVDAIAVGAGLLLAFGLGAIAGPLVASAMMDFFAPLALFAYTGAIGVGLALLSIVRIASKSAVSGGTKTEFVALSRSTPVAYALDPWSGDELVGGEGDEPTDATSRRLPENP